MSTFVRKKGEGKGKRVEIVKTDRNITVLRDIDSGFMFNISSFVFYEIYEEEKDDRNNKE